MKILKYFLVALVTTFTVSGCASMEKSYKKARKKNTFHAYKEFLKQYPEGNFADSCRIRLEFLYFQDAIHFNTLPALNKFIKFYPNSKYIDIIEQKIDSINFTNAYNSNEIDELENYIKNFPNGHYLKEAGDQIYSILLQQSDNRRKFPFNSYLEKYPDGAVINRAQIWLENYYYNIAINDKSVTKLFYFLDHYPKSKYYNDVFNFLIPALMHNGTADECDKFLTSFPSSEFSLNVQIKFELESVKEKIKSIFSKVRDYSKLHMDYSNIHSEIKLNNVMIIDTDVYVDFPQKNHIISRKFKLNILDIDPNILIKKINSSIPITNHREYIDLTSGEFYSLKNFSEYHVFIYSKGKKNIFHSFESETWIGKKHTMKEYGVRHYLIPEIMLCFPNRNLAQEFVDAIELLIKIAPKLKNLNINPQ